MTVHLKRWSACLGALVLLGLLGLPGRASAVVIYHSGEDAFPVMDMTDDILESLAAELQVPDEEKAQFKQDFAGQKIGYQCEIFGLFWAYFAWWNCGIRSSNRVPDMSSPGPYLGPHGTHIPRALS